MPLSDRITAALTGNTTSVVLGDLIEEVQREIPIAKQAVEAARRQLLDPARKITAADRVAVQAAEETAARLEAAREPLAKRLDEITDAEELARWRPKHAAAKDRRDAAAARLAAMYPQFIDEFCSVLAECEAADAQVREVNFSAPANGAEGSHLCSTEELARGPDAGRHQNLTLLKDLRLVSWSPSSVAVWPPRRVIDPAMISPQPSSDAQRFSSDWWRAGHKQSA